MRHAVLQPHSSKLKHDAQKQVHKFPGYDQLGVWRCRSSRQPRYEGECGVEHNVFAAEDAKPTKELMETGDRDYLLHAATNVSPSTTRHALHANNAPHATYWSLIKTRATFTAGHGRERRMFFCSMLFNNEGGYDNFDLRCEVRPQLLLTAIALLAASHGHTARPLVAD